MLSKKLTGAARMRRRCWPSVTRRCSTKFASLDWIQGAPRARIAKKKVRGEVELPDPVPFLLILHQPANIASWTSTCNFLLNESGELPCFPITRFGQDGESEKEN